MNMKVIGAAALAAACVAGCCKKDEVLVTVNGQSLTRCMLDKDVASHARPISPPIRWSRRRRCSRSSLRRSS